MQKGHILEHIPILIQVKPNSSLAARKCWSPVDNRPIWKKNNNNIPLIHAKLYFAVVQTVFIIVSNNVLFIYYHVSWEFQYAGKSREHGLMRAYLLQ